MGKFSKKVSGWNFPGGRLHAKIFYQLIKFVIFCLEKNTEMRRMRNELVRLFPNNTAITKLRDIPILYSKMTK